jgi:hypothetical protein
MLPRTHHKVRAPATPTHAQCRDNEWFSAFVMCAWAVILALPGDALSGPSFSAFHRQGLTEVFWAGVFGSVGGLRLTALYINGRNPKTPYARMLGAAFGFVAWAYVGTLVYLGTMDQLGVISPGCGVYSVLALAEIRSLYRASYDARYVSR